MRRAFDLICAAAGLLVLALLFPVIALAIKLEDGGPIIYSQRRAGKDFGVFRLYKFRTMIVGPDRSGALTAPEDARITRLGRVLRKYHDQRLAASVGTPISFCRGPFQIKKPQHTMASRSYSLARHTPNPC